TGSPPTSSGHPPPPRPRAPVSPSPPPTPQHPGPDPALPPPTPPRRASAAATAVFPTPVGPAITTRGTFTPSLTGLSVSAEFPANSACANPVNAVGRGVPPRLTAPPATNFAPALA